MRLASQDEMNTTALIKNFHADLNLMKWPKILYLKDGKTFQDLVVALDVEVDWHFEETDDGFPYFLIGPTMVRVDNQGQPGSARLVPTKEQHFIAEWKKNESVSQEFKEKIIEMVEDGDLRVETTVVPSTVEPDLDVEEVISDDPRPGPKEAVDYPGSDDARD